MQTIVTTIQSINPRICTLFLGAVLISLVGLYMYLVGMSVVHVVMSKETSQHISSIKSDISELETAYIDAQHSVRAELALQEGFEARTEKTFIVSSGATVVVTRNE